MLSRVYSKKKRPLLLTGAEAESGSIGGSADYNCVSMPRPVVPTRVQQQQQQQSQQHQQQYNAPRSSRLSRAFGGKDERHGGSGAGRLVKKVFGGAKKDRHDYDAAKFNGGGVMYSEDDEYDLGEDADDGEYDEDEEHEQQQPQVLRPRRRFVRSGLTTYEQWISKNAMGRRFSRRSVLDQPSGAPMAPADGYAAQYSPTNDENSPVNRDGRADSGDNSGMSSLSSALQEVIYSRPTALKSIVDPTAGPIKVQKSFVVEQNAAGDYFVASRRVPHGPVRVTKDDSFIDTSTSGDGAHSEFQQHQAAANPGRRSDMDFLYRNKWGTASALSTASGGVSSAAALLAMGTAGVRRRLSGADPHETNAPANTVAHHPVVTGGAPPMRRSASTGKSREASRGTQALATQMAYKCMDHMRQRSRSRSADAAPSFQHPRGRKESTAMLQAASSFEDIDVVPLTVEDLTERKLSMDKGPMTMDEFMFEKSTAVPTAATGIPSPALVRKQSGSKSSSRTRRSSKAKTEEEEEDEPENMFSQSFRNLKDVDALKRSRSLEDENKVAATTVAADETEETDEESPDFADERATDDLDSSYGSSYDDESAVRPSNNITEFLGGFKSRNSMNRNSLVSGRNSLGRNSMRKDDFVSRAARSLRNSRKAAQETVKISSELSRKLREARARVPMDLRGEPPMPTHKKRGFLGREARRVRFDPNRYCREFEVIEPEESDDDHEVRRWQQRDSEMDDDDEEEDDDDDDENNSTDDDGGDFGVPIPGAVLAAAMTDANAYYSNYGALQPARVSSGRASAMENDKRVSVVSRKSSGNQFEVLL